MYLRHINVYNTNVSNIKPNHMTFIKQKNPAHYPPPCIRSTSCFRVFYITTLNCFEYSLQESYFGWIMCHLFGLNVIYFGIMSPTFLLYTVMCLIDVGRPFTVKNPPLKKRDILLGPCLDNMTAR